MRKGRLFITAALLLGWATAASAQARPGRPARRGRRCAGRRPARRHRDRSQRDAHPSRRHQRSGRIPADQSAAGHLHAHRRAGRVCDVPPRGHPAARRRDLPGRHHDEARRRCRRRHRHRRLADDRGGQAEQRPEHQRRVPARRCRSRRGATGATSSSSRPACISRGFDDGSGRQVVFRPQHRALRPRRPARRRDRRRTIRTRRSPTCRWAPTWSPTRR